MVDARRNPLMLHRSRIRAALLALFATFALTGPAAAGEFRSEQSVTVAEGESIDDDLYVAAGTVNIDGTVNGDATVAGGTVQVSGTVTGSLNVGGGTVDVTGDVTGAVRVSAGTVRIAGSVGRDVVAFGGNVTIESDAQVAGDVAGGVGMLVIDGAIGGDVRAGAGTMAVGGTVDGGIDVSVGDLTIESGAVVGGNVTYLSAREATIADDAQIGGEVTREEPAPETPGDGGGGGALIPDNPIVTYIGVLLGMLLLGWGMLAIRPRLTLGSADALRTAPLLTVGVGLGALIGQFVLIAILVLIGILLAIIASALGGAVVAAGFVVLLLIVLAIILSVVPIAMAIGHLLLADRSPYLAYLAGAAILALVVVAGGYVPALGALVFFIVWLLGLGAFVVYAFRTRERPYVIDASPPATAAVAPPA
jgi:cytoskeletal protein CcmA (bactofilin family)